MREIVIWRHNLDEGISDFQDANVDEAHRRNHITRTLPSPLYQSAHPDSGDTSRGFVKVVDCVIVVAAFHAEP